MDSYLEPKLCWLNTPTLWTSASLDSGTKSAASQNSGLYIKTTTLIDATYSSSKNFLILFFFGDDVEFTELDVPEAVSAFSDESDADSSNYKQFSLIETFFYCVVKAARGSCLGSSALPVTLGNLLKKPHFFELNILLRYKYSETFSSHRLKLQAIASQKAFA